MRGKIKTQISSPSKNDVAKKILFVQTNSKNPFKSIILIRFIGNRYSLFDWQITNFTFRLLFNHKAWIICGEAIFVRIEHLIDVSVFHVHSIGFVKAYK